MATPCLKNKQARKETESTQPFPFSLKHVVSFYIECNGKMILGEKLAVDQNSRSLLKLWFKDLALTLPLPEGVAERKKTEKRVYYLLWFLKQVGGEPLSTCLWSRCWPSYWEGHCWQIVPVHNLCSIIKLKFGEQGWDRPD